MLNGFEFAEKEPKARELLRPDETIINPHYMKQLLIHGIGLGMSDRNAFENMDFDAESVVRVLTFSVYSSPPPSCLQFLLTWSPLYTASGRRATRPRSQRSERSRTSGGGKRDGRGGAGAGGSIGDSESEDFGVVNGQT